MGCFGSTANGNTEANIGGAGRLNECYIMGQELGSGGSCTVYAGTGKGEKEGGEFAIKKMEKESHRNVNQKMYQKEIDILGALDHPNVIKLEDYFEDEDNFYVVTVLANGGELFDRIADSARFGSFTEKSAAKLINTMLQTLDYIHDLGIVHRDLKPENFVFETMDADSNMILIDFGCAKKVEDDTVYRDIVGTPYYLAPESASKNSHRDGRILKKSDVWAVGVIAYVMLTGTPPFRGRNHKDILGQILRKPVAYPNSVRDKLSDGFKDFISHTLKKSPRRRPTAKEALTHAWVSGKDASDVKIDKDIIKCLQQYKVQSKLKKNVSRLLADNMGGDSQEKIRNHFNTIDDDQNGELDVNELTKLLVKLGSDPESAGKEAEDILTHADESKDKKIDFLEFSAIWQRKLLTVNDKYIRAVFKVIDTDGDRYITPEELSTLFGAKELEAQEMLKEVDTNQDGRISYEEFKRAMKEEDALALGSDALNLKKVQDGVTLTFDEFEEDSAEN